MSYPRWPLKPLSQLAEFRNGINYNQNNFGSGIPVVGVKDFQNLTKPKYENLEEINPEGIVTKRNLLRDGDILFVRSNGNRELIGRSLYIQTPPCDITHSAFTIRVRFTAPSLVPRFYAYLFRTSLIRHALTSHGGGTNISNLNQDILNNLIVPVPARAIQERIADILVAYDDLVENNLRRIRILDEMACALHREWFVNFRFPGHSGTPNSLPEGWRSQFAALAEIERAGVTPADCPDEVFDHFSIPAFDEERLPVPEPGKTILSAKYAVPPGAVLLSKLNPRIPRVWLPRVKGERRPIASTEFLVLVPREGVTKEFLYLKCSSDEFRGQFGALAIGTSTSHQRVQPASLLALPAALPPPELINKFTSFVAPMLEIVHVLTLEANNLRRTRDLLLPRLLSGQINLEDIEPAA